MRIISNNTNPYNNKRQTPTFGWMSICRANLIQHGVKEGKKLIPVDICLLQKEDKKFMEELAPKWERKTELGYGIIQNFLDAVKKGFNPHPAAACGKSYLMVMPIETVEITPKISLIQKVKSILARIFNKPDTTPPTTALYDEPLSLSAIERDGDTFQLCLLQSHHNIVEQSYSKRVSGAGRLQIYGVSKIIEALGANKLEIESINDSFYKKIFHQKRTPYKHSFSIEKKNLQEFMKETEEIHKIEVETQIPPDKLLKTIKTGTFIIH